MSADDVEQGIRRHPTANERFLLGLLDEARDRLGRTEFEVERYAQYETGGRDWNLIRKLRSALKGASNAA